MKCCTLLIPFVALASVTACNISSAQVSIPPSSPSPVPISKYAPPTDLEAFIADPQQDPPVELSVARTCNHIYFRAKILRQDMKFNIRAELRSSPGNELLGTLSFTRSSGHHASYFYGTEWIRLDDTKPTNDFRLTAIATLDDKGVLISDEKFQLSRPATLKDLPAPAEIRSADLDALVASSAFGMQDYGNLKRLFVHLPPKGKQWPSNIGFAATLEGLDDDGKTVFTTEVVKSARTDLAESFWLDDSIAIAEYDRATHLRIRGAPCLAPLGGNFKEAWSGEVLVTLPHQKDLPNFFAGFQQFCDHVLERPNLWRSTEVFQPATK